MPIVSVNVQMGLKEQVISVIADSIVQPVAKVQIKDLVATLIEVAEKNNTNKIKLTGPKRFIAPFKDLLKEKGFELGE